MKITPPRSCAACLLIGTVLAFAFSNARTAAEKPIPVKRAPMIEIEARFVRATPEQMGAAVGGKLNGAGPVMLTSEEYEKALRMLKAAKADFFSHSRAVAKSGRKAIIESVRELRYPSDYVPSGDDPTKYIPTAFDTEDIGTVLEFGPTIEGEKKDAIDLQLVVSVVSFLGFVDESTPGEKLKDKTIDELKELTKAALPEGAIWNPIMAKEKVTTRATVPAGHTWVYFQQQGVAGVPPKQTPLDFYLFITARVIAPK